MSEQPYDSAPDTREHITKVQINVGIVASRLIGRSLVHDQSKLESPEKEAFDRATTELATLTYGSREYHDAKNGLGKALNHHYHANSHHPEHYENGVDGMSLLDILEMFADWKAASERHNDGDFSKSLEHNEQRFELSPQLAQIFRNTQKELGW